MHKAINGQGAGDGTANAKNTTLSCLPRLAAPLYHQINVYLDHKLSQQDVNGRWFLLSEQFNAEDEPVLANIHRTCTTLAARFLSPLLHGYFFPPPLPVVLRAKTFWLA